MTKKASTKYAPEVRERAVRMVFEHQGEHASQWTAIGSIAAKIGCTAETLRGWVRQAERDQGLRAGPTTDDRERIKALEREVRELRQANEISAARRRRILPRRSSTAGPSHDRVHRRSPRRLVRWFCRPEHHIRSVAGERAACASSWHRSLEERLRPRSLYTADQTGRYLGADRS